MEDILKQLTASAENPMADGVAAMVDLFKERFGDLKPADQASVMAFIGGGTVLDILLGEVGKITARMGTDSKDKAGVSFITSAMAVQTAQEIVAAGVTSAFTAGLRNAKKEGPKV